ncbi:bifunctional 5,10-methylenetetrahydrofolate dehydrogenase/5,10-methenyltetrahydrofolate cyclohydrolase [Hydrogenibacillus sp. N12]|uniref:bifunctional 5,10-methylenetetrahydrofolate dehydrogenase/5,10-methenyltetrahydrofolate cyclohydrolase n=1 Tax=Hydrogenibacillus sp. N12 TaxID=2866627 RepID=UPI001C7E0DD6|nr:bifunctional 5,10-methylenetetrahydrofolate dehydrogenase/5,10-methenyltetrahydrofolate cyclohydrolase [Hydrogenibacillus sp. N12]QZA32033.1 bifunctional 5,10-methylenetetrahydrofolate dehydrogenase/5,10-methenyltetrahydrofolate cyclohydrolase [Hydrogenibacillus sp. N12]
MGARTIDGRAVAERVMEELRQEVAALRAGGVWPHLTVVLVGDDPASATYVRSKAKKAEAVGMRSTVVRLPAEVAEAELVARVRALSDDPDVDGVIVQLPLPPHIDEAAVIEAIDPAKDVDGFTPENAGRLFRGDASGLVPCTPKGIVALLDAYDIPIAGRHAVVVGRSNIVGRPAAQLLLMRDAAVTMLHSRSGPIGRFTREADIVVVAVGKKHFFGPEFVKPGAVVIDVGIHRDEAGHLVGDVHPAVAEVAEWLTPVPGGVGPMTVAMLLKNTVLAARRRRGWRDVAGA